MKYRNDDNHSYYTNALVIQQGDLEWYRVPLDQLENYFVTKCGKVGRYKEKHGYIIIANKHIRSGYQYVPASKLGKTTFYAVHRLVAITFIPLPTITDFIKGRPSKDGIDFQVNHKNGCKTDNRVDNLEWLTPEENSLHAKRTRLIATCGVYEIIDLETDTIKIVYSLTELTKILKCSKETATGIIGSDIPFRSKYLINEIDQDIRFKDKFEEGILNVVVYDYVTREVSYYLNATHASKSIGINSKTISDRMATAVNKRLDKPMAGYEFFYKPNLKDGMPEWLDYSSEQAKKDRDHQKEAWAVGLPSYIKPYLVYNVETKEEKRVWAISAIAKILSVPTYSLKNYMRLNKDTTKPLSIYKGYCIKKEDDPRTWDDIEKPPTPTIKAFNIKTGEETYHVSIKTASRDTGMSATAIRDQLDRPKVLRPHPARTHLFSYL